MKFTELNLNPALLKAIRRAGFEEATPIQAQTIPLVLQGKDVIGQAQTGTGKTAAFGLPLLQRLDLNNHHIQALVIEPTRELAIQTQEELFRLGCDEKARVQVVYGGANIARQIKALKQPTEILVGTPGRLIDHLKRKTVKLDQVQTVVLDEADEMLDMGFIQDIEAILNFVKKDHQTLLFSATVPQPILKIGERFMKEPAIVKIKSKNLTADLIDQYFVRCRDEEKFDLLCRLLDVQSPDLALVFVRTKKRVDEVNRGLLARGYNAAGIHGDLTQKRRLQVLRSFRAGKIDILVATDVAARGLDISGVTHVYNFDMPQDPDSYVHRIGRTGRAGKDGLSVTFVTADETGYLSTIEHLTKKKMKPLQPPSSRRAFQGQLAAEQKAISALVGSDLSKYMQAASSLLEDYSALDLAAALVKVMSKDASQVAVHISPQRPLSKKAARPWRSHKRKLNNRRHYKRPPRRAQRRRKRK